MEKTHHRSDHDRSRWGNKLFGSLCVISLCLFYSFPVVAGESASSAEKQASFTEKQALDRGVELDVDTSKVVETSFDIKELLVLNPAVADVRLRDKRSFHIEGFKTGSTQILAISQDKKQELAIDVKVTHAISKLKKLIERIAPENNVDITSVPNGLMLSGDVLSTDAASTIDLLTRQFLGKKDILINNLVYKGPSTQISLNVKVAEVTYTAMNNLNANLSGTIKKGNFTLGLTTPTAAVTTQTLNFNGGTNSNILLTLDALVQSSLASILAEPNLMTVSGKSASFNVGGEIPYPVPSNNSISIEYKKYGIILTFTPTLIGDSIYLKLETEVSSPDNTLSVKLQGYVVPALTTKKASTEVVLQNGQSLMIAGLIYNATTASSGGTPGLSEIPGLGALFRSDSLNNEKRELVIIVTPFLVEPLPAIQDAKLPTEGIQFVNMIDRLITGKLAINTSGDTQSSFLASEFIGEAGVYYE